ncbi:hypothetical protein GQ42DRAFT_27141 [Ramicandelaber brevisporus]|nr:hypothetical protein GQ42DRAFT_27141 [Ramicandelaber brevisporus]
MTLPANAVLPPPSVKNSNGLVRKRSASALASAMTPSIVPSSSSTVKPESVSSSEPPVSIQSVNHADQTAISESEAVSSSVCGGAVINSSNNSGSNNLGISMRDLPIDNASSSSVSDASIDALTESLQESRSATATTTAATRAITDAAATVSNATASTDSINETDVFSVPTSPTLTIGRPSLSPRTSRTHPMMTMLSPVSNHTLSPVAELSPTATLTAATPHIHHQQHQQHQHHYSKRGSAASLLAATHAISSSSTLSSQKRASIVSLPGSTITPIASLTSTSDDSGIARSASLPLDGSASAAAAAAIDGQSPDISGLKQSSEQVHPPSIHALHEENLMLGAANERLRVQLAQALHARDQIAETMEMARENFDRLSQQAFRRLRQLAEDNDDLRREVRELRRLLREVIEDDDGYELDAPIPMPDAESSSDASSVVSGVPAMLTDSAIGSMAVTPTPSASVKSTFNAPADEALPVTPAQRSSSLKISAQRPLPPLPATQ